MTNEKLKPKLFSVMKTYTKQQFAKDVISGIMFTVPDTLRVKRGNEIAGNKTYYDYYK